MKPTVDGGMMFNLIANNGRVICTSQVYENETTCMIGIESVKHNSRSKVEDLTKEKHRKHTNPKYEIFMDMAGQYRFHLKAMNGEIVAASEGYTSKESCKKGIASISRNAVDAPVIRK
jgi:uncharacterized protein YegP (UPF0339 family)